MCVLFLIIISRCESKVKNKTRWLQLAIILTLFLIQSIVTAIFGLYNRESFHSCQKTETESRLHQNQSSKTNLIQFRLVGTSAFQSSNLVYRT